MEQSAGSSEAVQFTVNPVLFTYCGNLVSSASKFTLASIMRLRADSGNKTSVSLTSWNELATTLLDLPPSTAQHIFDVFFSISGGCIQGMPSYARHYATQKDISRFRHENNRSLLNQMGSSIDEKSWNSASASRLISMPGLIMFLSVQLFISRSAGSLRSEERKLAEFLKANIHDYISAIAISKQDKVTAHDISDLEFVLRQYIDGEETSVGSGENYFPWQKDGEHAASVSMVSQFVRNRIVTKNVLPANEKHNGIQINGLEDTIHLLSQPSLLTPNMSYLSATCDIVRCLRSSIYLPCPLPNTRISALHDCTVVLGPVAGVLLVENCVKCKITALCGSVVISQCEDVEVYVCSNTPPVLLSGLKNVFLAPYNTFYSMMSRDCQETGINPILNLWNIGIPQSFQLSPDKYSPISFLASPSVSKEWSNAGVPPTTTNICRVSSTYQNAVKNRLQNFQNVSNEIRYTYKLLQEEGHSKEAGLLRNRIHLMFIEWVHQHGQGKAISDLLHQQNSGNW